MKQSTKHTLIIGFALFSMFFGAGNLIFPPYLGLESGPDWLQGFLCYYIADVGLALAALFAILKSGDTDGITKNLGRVPAVVMMCIIILCIGPFVAIPRTAATTYEMFIQPLFPNIPAVVFSVGFFLLILLLCLKESAVVDIVGKFLTPVLVIGLLILIVKGILSPIGDISEYAYIDNVAEQGIKAGYQTLDVLAVMVFGVLILKTAEEKGYTETKEKKKIVAGAGVIASIGLLITYMGLTFLGATASRLNEGHITRSELVVKIVKTILGSTGVVIFAIVVALACVTTALALVSSAAEYFTELCKGKVSYKAFVIIICVISAVFSNVGLDVIVSLASPVLDMVYPPMLVLIFMTLCLSKKCGKITYRFAFAGALLSSMCITAYQYGLPFETLTKLPLYSLGFGWILPTAIVGVIGFICEKRHS